MISDTVWNEALSRAKAVCDAHGRELLDPLLQDLSLREDPYWMLPAGAASSNRMGLGEVSNEETGQVLLVLMLPVGRMSTPDALQNCQSMSDAFLQHNQPGDRPWPSGLFYDGQDFIPPDLDRPGNWYTMTLMVSYRFQTVRPRIT